MHEAIPEKYRNDGYTSLEEPEEFFLWPFCRIIFGILLIAFGLTSVMFLSRIWTKDYDRLSEIDVNPQTPVKFFLENMTASSYQGNRSTSWAFATINALQQSYYEAGRETGLLISSSEALFSVQAYAITVVNECLSNSTDNSNICKEPGKKALENSTQHGDIAWLSYLKNVWTKVFPRAICEYQNYTENEFTCDNLDTNISSGKNPLRFSIDNVSMAYETTTVKELLYRNSVALPLSFGITDVHWTIPCPEGGVSSSDENAESYSHYCTRVSNLSLISVPCPPSITKVDSSDVCYVLVEPSITLDGEFFTDAHPQKITGEHSVTVVGWNDEQMTSPIPRRNPAKAQLPGQRTSRNAYAKENAQGIATAQGGFIVQDSFPGPSHTMMYWSGNFSTWDERYVCPNPEYPRNWLSCTNVANVTRKFNRQHPNRSIRAPPRHRNMGDRSNQQSPVAMCAQDDTYMGELLEILRQPYEFTCVNYTDSDNNTYQLYDCNTSNRYFLSEFDVDANGLVTGNFYAVPSSDSSSYETYTLRKLTEREISNTLQPLSAHLTTLTTDSGNCGYHFLPYIYLDATSQFARWYAMQYNITWEEHAFTNAQSSKYDYTLLKESKYTRKRLWFDGPLPLANGTRNDSEL